MPSTIARVCRTGLRLAPLYLACVSCAPRRSGLPRTDPTRPARTSAAISAADLRARLYAFAADSMMGRATGEEGDYKAAQYVAGEFARLGLEPAGDGGSWFQTVPFLRRAVDRGAALRVNGYAAKLGVDYVPTPSNAAYRPIDNVQTVFAGLASDSTTWISPAAADGKALVFSVTPPEQRTAATRRTNTAALVNSPRFRGAAAILVAELDAAGTSTAAAMISGNLVFDTTWRTMTNV